MEEKRWESCNAEALLEEFFSQDDLRQLALSTGELLGCPLLVLDDTFHVAAHYLPLGFSDALFETTVRCGEITYEAGAIISKNAMLTAGWADYVQLADSSYRWRFAPLISAGVRLGCLICVDTDGHLEQIPPRTWELVEHILAKQLFMEVSRQDKPSETAEDILMHLLDGGFSSAAHFQLQASGTYLADFHPLTFALIDLETYHNAYMGKRHLKEELEAQLPDSHPFLYQGDVFLFLHREGDADTLSTLAKEFQLKILVSEPLDELFDLPRLYRTAREALERVGLGQRMKHRPAQLSGGQQQRCAIARAIAVKPSLILADEPTGNLDKKTGREILQIFRELHQAGNTIVLITHDPKVAQSAERVIRIEDGQLYENQEVPQDDLPVV